MTDGPSSPRPASRPRLLLIDPDPADRALAGSVLATLFPFAELTSIGAEDELLDALKRTTYDIVIAELDAGWAPPLFVLGTLRARQEEAAILVFSQAEDPELQRQVLHAGAAEYVVKSSRGFLDLSRGIDAILQARALDGGAARPDDETEHLIPSLEPMRAAAEARAPASGALEAAGEVERTRPGRRAGAFLGRLAGSEAGIPLAAFALVLAVTALLTFHLAGRRSGPAEGSLPVSGIVAAEVVTSRPPGDPAGEPPPEPSSTEIPAADPKPPEPSDAALSLELRARQEVWVRLTIDGAPVLDATLRAGQSRTFEGERIADLMIGNAGGITVFWNGRDLGALGRTGQVRRLHFSPTEFGRGPPPASWTVAAP